MDGGMNRLKVVFVEKKCANTNNGWHNSREKDWNLFLE